MTERTETVTEREYDANGNLTKETITTVVEKRDDRQRYPYTNTLYYTGTELTGRTAADTALATSNRLEATTTTTAASAM